jgi:hypothetical protein
VQENPSWFTADLIARIPNDFIPKRHLEALNQAAGGQRRSTADMGTAELLSAPAASRNGRVLSQSRFRQSQYASNGDEGFSDNMTTMPLAEVPYLTRACHSTHWGLAPQQGTSTLVARASPAHMTRMA